MNFRMSVELVVDEFLLADAKYGGSKPVNTDSGRESGGKNGNHNGEDIKHHFLDLLHLVGEFGWFFRIIFGFCFLFFGGNQAEFNRQKLRAPHQNGEQKEFWKSQVPDEKIVVNGEKIKVLLEVVQKISQMGDSFRHER